MKRLSRNQREDGEMNCEQFQRILPQIIEGGGSAEEEAHLRSCEACSELVSDLRYIAEQAKLLLPLHDPNPRVWSNIQESLVREGLVREGGMSLAGQKTAPSKKKKSWTTSGLMLAAMAVLTLAEVLANYPPSATPVGKVAARTAAPGDNSGAYGRR